MKHNIRGFALFVIQEGFGGERALQVQLKAFWGFSEAVNSHAFNHLKCGAEVQRNETLSSKMIFVDFLM